MIYSMGYEIALFVVVIFIFLLGRTAALLAPLVAAFEKRAVAAGATTGRRCHTTAMAAPQLHVW